MHGYTVHHAAKKEVMKTAFPGRSHPDEGDVFLTCNPCNLFFGVPRHYNTAGFGALFSQLVAKCFDPDFCCFDRLIGLSTWSRLLNYMEENDLANALHGAGKRCSFQRKF